MSKVIPNGKLELTCLLGQGHACCRYIVAGSEGIECVKHMPEFKSQIDRRVELGLFTARGDNCEGIR